MHSFLTRHKVASVQLSLLFAICPLSMGLQAAPKSKPVLQDYAETKDEAFLIRRIAEFWKDEDYKLVKVQIQQFLKEFPKSKINDHLRGILADLYLQDEAYSDALHVYEEIKDAEINEKILINKLQCYYELNEFDEMIRAGTPYLTKQSSEIDLRKEEFQFLMAEALFRHAITSDEKLVDSANVEQAKPLYEAVLHSSFNDPAMFALAEIYKMTGDHKKASAFFAELSMRHPERTDELLFHAGLSQAEYDRTLAIETFSKIVKNEGPKADEAALNRLILYFQDDRFKEVIETYPTVAASIESEKEASLDYIIGRSYFAEKDFEQASKFLTRFVKNEEKASPQLRNSLLMQMNCSQKLGKEDVYKETISHLQQKFPSDSELPQGIFIHAMMLKEAGDFISAEEKLEYLIANYPEFEDKETLFLEYSLVTYNNGKWEKSHSTLASFLHHFPTSPHSKIAWKYHLSCSLNLLKEAETEGKTTYTKDNFFEDLTKILAQEGVLNEQEARECRFLQGKVCYELGYYDQSLEYLTKYLDDYKDDPSAAETHLLVALCHHQLNEAPELFCRHAEEALKMDPELQSKSSIHLELYNVYLSILEKGKNLPTQMQIDSDESLTLHDLTAEHLYQALSLQDLPIKLENRLWLANYYYDKLLAPKALYEADQSTEIYEESESFKRAFQLYKQILMPAEHLTSIDQSHVFLEWEVLKFANLLGREKRLTEKVTLLKELVMQQQNAKTWEWKLQKEALLELAKTYEYLQDTENAYETYAFLTKQHGVHPTFVSEYANLHANRLQFYMLPENSRQSDDSRVVAILNQLKELQIRKHVQSEPIHLEASLEYAWIRAHVADHEESLDKYLFFLNRMKDDYQNAEDPILARYNKQLLDNQEKAELQELYLGFLEAEILRTEASIAQRNNEIAKADELFTKAETKLNAQLTSQHLTHYLYHRIQTSLKAIQTRTLS